MGIKVKTSLRFDSETLKAAAVKAKEEGSTVTELVNTAVRGYLAQDEADISLYMSKFNSVDHRMYVLENRIHGLQNTLLYFIQTYLFSNPQIKDGWYKEPAFTEAGHLTKTWWDRMIKDMHDYSPDLFTELITIALDRPVKGGQMDENSGKI
jgi:hypothetical protein